MNFQFSIFPEGKPLASYGADNFQFLFIFLLIFCLILPSFAFAQAPIEVPKTLEEAGKMADKALETTKKELPGTLERIWKEEVLPIWQKMYNWFIVNIWSKIKGWFQKEVTPAVKEEIEKRKPIIEEELKKEKEQVKTELPKAGKSLWEYLF